MNAAAAALEHLAAHGARLDSVEKQVDKSEASIVRVEEKVDGLKTLAITTLVLVSLALAAMLGNVVLQPRVPVAAQTVAGSTGKR
jgi:hypothetical protein